MKIVSIKTGLPQDISEEHWQKMIERGDSRKFKIVDTGSSPQSKPEELESVDYSALVKKANKFKKDGKNEKALELFQKAHAIKPTNFIASKIDELDNILNNSEELS